MIKISLLISYLTVATSIAAAQSYQGIDRTISFGISGGYSFSDMLLTSPYKEDIYATEATPFSLGLTADFKFNDYFSIMPGISYAGKGGNLNAIYVAESGTQV